MLRESGFQTYIGSAYVAPNFWIICFAVLFGI